MEQFDYDAPAIGALPPLSAAVNATLPCPYCEGGHETERDISQCYTETARDRFTDQVHHEQDREASPFPCRVGSCQKHFKSKQGLRYHQSVMHGLRSNR